MHNNQKEKQRSRKISFREAKEKVTLRVKWSMVSNALYWFNKSGTNN